jgi:hypothetical protein
LLLRAYENKIFLIDIKRLPEKATLLEGSKKAALVKKTSLQTNRLIVLVKGASKKELLACETFKDLVKTVNSKVKVV